MKPGGVEISEAVCVFLIAVLLLRSLGKRFPSSASFSRHLAYGLRRTPTRRQRTRPSLSNDGAALAMGGKNLLPVLLSNDAL
jgi:hypothetical protein